MIEQGKRILTAEVGGWYDCGNPRRPHRDQPDPAPEGQRAAAAASPAVTIHEPVFIEEGVDRSSAAPSAPTSRSSGTPPSSTAGSSTPSSVATASFAASTLSQSLLGDYVQVRDVSGTASLGDHAELHGVPD